MGNGQLSDEIAKTSSEKRKLASAVHEDATVAKICRQFSEGDSYSVINTDNTDNK